MGSVYKAEQPSMNRLVAIKVLHPRFANRDDLVSRFRREARAMSQLSHPNTARVYKFGELPDGAAYFVMDYMEGKNLAHTVRAEGPMERRPRAQHHDPGVRGARRSAPRRHHSPRPQAREHLPHPAGRHDRLPEGARLRPGQGERTADGARLDDADPAGHGVRHARIHEPGANPRREARSPQRHLLAGLDPVRALDRQAAVRCRKAGRYHARARA